MSLTLLEQPLEAQPAYNPIVYKYGSTLTGQTNFEYQLTIETTHIDPDPTVSGFTAWSEIAELRQPPNPDGIAIFDISKYLANELTYIVDPDNANVVSVLNAGKIHLKYRVTPAETYSSDLTWQFNEIEQYEQGGVLRPLFKRVLPLSENHEFNSYPTYLAEVTFDAVQPNNEDWDNRVFTIEDSTDTQLVKFSDAPWKVGSITGYTKSGVIKLISDVEIVEIGSTSSNRQAFNGVREWHQFPAWLSTNESYQYFASQYITDLTTFKFLTSVPADGFNIQPHNKVWINGQSPSWVGGDSIVVETDNGTFTYDLGNEVLSNIYRATVQTFGVGVPNLSGTTPTSVFAGSLPVIDDDTSFIRFWFSNTATVNLYSDKYTLNVVNPCSIYEKFTLIYLDRFGSMIPANFTLVNRKNIVADRTDFRQNWGSSSPGGNTIYNAWDRGKTNINTMLSERVTITSDWVNELHSDLIVEMIGSPAVYHQDESGTLRAINIINTNIEKKQTINDQLINHSISFEYSQKNNSNI